MVISKAGVAAFEDRKRRNSRTIRKFSEERLDKKIEELGLTTECELRMGQKMSLLLAWVRESYLILLGMGGGKTLISLELFKNRRDKGQANRCLVLVPNVVNLTAWELEVAKHMKGMTVGVVDGIGPDERWAIVEDPEIEVVVITYQGLLSLCSRPKLKGKKGWRLDPKGCARFKREFEVMVMDESTAFKRHDSHTFAIIRNLSKGIPYRYALTGTPFDKNPEDLWSQFYAIDHGYTLGETLGLFRESFFNEVETHWKKEYHFRKSQTDRLHRYLAHSSLRLTQADCQDLPEQIGGLGGEDYMIRSCVMPASTWKFQSKLASELKDAHGDRMIAKMKYHQMRALSSGWLGTNIGEEGEKVDIVFQENPKFDAVIQLLDEIPADENVVIIHWFHKTGELFRERLKKEKVSATWIYGKTTKQKKKEALLKFGTKGGPRVLLASSAISKGVNLQAAAKYMIFLESPDFGLDRLQLEGRILREGGLPGERRYYDMCMKATMDETILEGLRTGMNLVDMIVDNDYKLPSSNV
jgi:SNF2 family DNA or RNA helicase